MAEYCVKYEIDVAARSPRQAARIAWDLICGQAADRAALPPVLAVERAGARKANVELFELTRGGQTRRLPHPQHPGD